MSHQRHPFKFFSIPWKVLEVMMCTPFESLPNVVLGVASERVRISRLESFNRRL